MCLLFLLVPNPSVHLDSAALQDSIFHRMQKVSELQFQSFLQISFCIGAQLVFQSTDTISQAAPSKVAVLLLACLFDTYSNPTPLEVDCQDFLQEYDILPGCHMFDVLQ